MTDFEDQLRRALERKEPSADFAARVTTRVSLENGRRTWRPWRSWTAAGIAASLLLGAAGLQLERRERIRQGVEARVQLLQAIEITSAKLNKIQKKVQGAGR
jgi:hypothetical protein